MKRTNRALLSLLLICLLLTAGCAAGETADGTPIPSVDPLKEPGTGTETVPGEALSLDETDRLLLRSLEVTREETRELARLEITDGAQAAEIAARWAGSPCVGTSRPMDSPRLELSFYGGDELLGQFFLDAAGVAAGEGLGRGNYQMEDRALYAELTAMLAPMA